MNKTTWRLRAGADRRFRSGHPWVYSNELAESPKGIEPGAPIELHDASGAFLARGYGNPGSLIAFRALSRDEREVEPLSSEGILARLQRAGRIREALGLGEVSHRLCFGEADALPGLVIDRYALAPRGQVFVVQAHTAGMNRALPEVLRAIESYASGAWTESAVVVKNDVGSRKLEGLEEQEPRVAHRGPELRIETFDRAKILVGSQSAPVEFEVDLLTGQKTGFFLDQTANVALAARLFTPWARGRRGKLRILDLCCYVGQWSTQLSRALASRDRQIEVVAVDASARALELAKRNVESQGARCETMKGDVLRDLAGLEEESFDLVICDPPALIKGRKDIAAGTHAYLNANTQVFRLVKPDGAVVSSSCSYLLEEESFLTTLAKAARRNGADVRWVARGTQAPDHPVLAEFPEGRYLKAWLGLMSRH